MNKFRLLFAALATGAATMLFSACDPKKNGSADITVTDERCLTQDVFADDTEGQSVISFSAAGAWTSLITEASTPSPEWIFIDPDHGDAAGNYTVILTLTPNISGADRTARITLSCNETSITVTVTQRGTTESGETPEARRLITGITETAVFESDYYSSGYSGNPYVPVNCEFTYDNSYRIKEMYSFASNRNEYDLFTWNYNVLGEVRIEDPSEPRIYRAVLNSKGHATSITWNHGSPHEASLAYDADACLTDHSSSDTYNYGSCNTQRLIWNNGNITALQKLNCGTQVYQVRSTCEYSPELNNKTSIDLNVLFFDILQEKITGDDYTVYQFPASIFALTDYTGKRSKNYLLKAEYPSMSEPSPLRILYTEATVPAVGSVLNTSYHREFYGNAVWEFDADNYPVKFTRRVEVTKIESIYNGERQYVEPSDEWERERWTEEYGPGPWFYVLKTNRETVKYDTCHWHIAYRQP
jgi:hypothetical protein